MGNTQASSLSEILSREEVPLKLCRDDIPEDVSHLSKQAREILGCLMGKLNDAEGELTNIRAQLQECTTILEHKKDIVARNKNIVAEVRRVLKERVGLACGDTMKKELGEVRRVFDQAEKAVGKDMDNIPEEAEKLKNEEKGLETAIDTLKKKIEKLESAQEMLQEEMTDETRKMLLLLREEGILIFGYSINCLIDKYRVFGEVESVFDIDEVMKQPLEDVGEGIRMSQPIDVVLGLKTGDIRTANISHNGVVAICYYNDEFKHYLQLTNLFTKQQVEFEIENWTATAFYDDKIIVMTIRQKLREAPVNALFTNPNKKTLQVIGSVELWGCPPDTLTQETRRVYYYSGSGDLYEYNVDTRENRKIETGHRVWYIASSGGIDMGVKCVFRDYDDNKIYALNMDNSVEYVNDGNGTTGWFTNVFPSSGTTDLSKALYRMYGNYFVFKNKKVKLECPVEFDDGYTIVRLYKDVFLAYDEDKKKWKLVRILVP